MHLVFAKKEEEKEEQKKKKDDEMVARYADKIINKIVYKFYMETNNLDVSAKFFILILRAKIPFCLCWNK